MKKKGISYQNIRRISQLLFLFLFLFLFRKTDYSGKDEIGYAANLFFRFNPLIALSTILAGKAWIKLVFPSVFTIALTILLGRVICGWVCPLGALIDIAGRFIKPIKKISIPLRNIKYGILFVILTSALFGLQLVGFFDPFSILVRGLTISIDPAVTLFFSSVFNSIYLSFPVWMTDISEAVYDFFKLTLLPYKQSFFLLSLFSFLILASVFVLELFGKRFWCRNLCPLGALFSLFSRYSFLRRVPAKSCPNCTKCAEICRMDAFYENGRIKMEECNLCMDCVDECEKQLAGFKLKSPKNLPPVSFKRRLVLQSCLAGLALPALSQVNAHRKLPKPFLLRPPGALDEKDFLSLCVRCGECMKVCIKNALQPDFMTCGYEGMFAPKLIPRMGYCEFNCTLCGQVCPTGAIKKLSLKEKQQHVIGKAFFDKNRCLPYAEKTPCIVCEEHCPIHDKAIKYKEVTQIDKNGKPVKLKQPYVILEKCIGCGICENMCPIDGESAVRVTVSNSAGIFGF